MTEHDSDEAFTREALRELPTIEPSAELLRRVRSIPLEHPRASGWSWTHWLESRWLPALAGAGALALGVFTGLGTLEDPSGVGSSDEIAAARPATQITATQITATQITADESEDAVYDYSEDVESWLALAWGGEADWDEAFDLDAELP